MLSEDYESPAGYESKILGHDERKTDNNCDSKCAKNFYNDQRIVIFFLIW